MVMLPLSGPIQGLLKVLMKDGQDELGPSVFKTRYSSPSSVEGLDYSAFANNQNYT